MSGTRTRTITCARCKQTRLHQSRGLCHTCWMRAKNTGTLGDYPQLKVDRVTQVEPFYGKGLTARQIATEIGCTVDAVEGAMRTIRQRMRARGETGPSWDSFKVTPPPSEPACAGYAPDVFTELQHGVNRQLMRDGVPSTGVVTQLDVAFSMCAACPVRDWCVDEAVLPHMSHATIIAGGALWIRGVRTWTVEDHAEWMYPTDVDEAVAS